MFRKGINVHYFIYLFVYGLKHLINIFQIDLENYNTRLIELDSCGESERTVFIMPPEMTDLPCDSMYSYKVKILAKLKIIIY